MLPAIWTGMRFPSSVPEALRFLHACGWECFELSTEHLEQIDADADPAARVEEALQAVAELKVTMPQAHAYLPANVAHPDPFRRDADLKRLATHLHLCAALQVEYVVIHPGTGDGYTNAQQLREVRQLNLDSFARLGDQAGALGLKIGLENTMDDRKRNRRNFGARSIELIDLLTALDHRALGITIDTSHANVQRLDASALISQFGRLLCCTHMSDNDGSGDQHRVPGVGTVNWQGVVTALRELDYQGIFNLEIPGESEPAPDDAALAARAREALAVTKQLLKT